MATQLQSRRGTTAQMNAFTGAEGEIAVNTSTDTLHVHDGSTAGGHALAKADGSNIATYAGSFTTIAASGTITGNVTGNLTGSVLTAAQTNITSVGTLSALTVSGTLTGTNATFTTADNSDNLTLTSTDADASSGPNVKLYRNSSSPADNDFLGNIKFVGRNDNSQDVQYAEQEVYILDASDGTEDGLYNVNVMTAGANTSYMQFKAGSGVVFNEDSNDIDFRVESDNNTHALFVQGSDGNVGIGVSSPSHVLHVDASSTSTLVTIHNTNGSSSDCRGLDVETSTTGTTVQRWLNAGSELGRFTATGNLLVGKSTTSFGTAGLRFAPTGAIDATVSGDGSLFLNRLGSDGLIQYFYKDGTNVGSIGTLSGTMYIGNGDCNLLFTGASDQMLPVGTNGATKDGQLDLGSYGNRFKDGYFSGDVNATNFTGVGDGDTFINMSGGNVMRFSTGNAERMRIGSDGSLSVGGVLNGGLTDNGFFVGGASGINVYSVNSSTSSSTYHVYDNGGAAYKFYVSYTGTIKAVNTTVSGISDVRWKENIRDLDDGLSKVMQLRPRKFDWKEGKGKDVTNDRGFIAQEFETVFPDLIDEWIDPAPEGEEPYKAVRADLIPTLVKAIQEQQAIIEALTARIETLEE